MTFFNNRQNRNSMIHLHFKVLLLVCVTFSSVILSNAQSFPGFFDRYKTESKFTSVDIGNKMFAAIADRESEKLTPELSTMLKELEGLKMISRKLPEGNKLLQEARGSIDIGNLDQLMNVKTDEGETIEIYSKDLNNDRSELYLINQSPDNFVFAILWGKLDLLQIAKLGDVLSLPGLEHLGDIPK